jgi:hypothetical protein
VNLAQLVKQLQQRLKSQELMWFVVGFRMSKLVCSKQRNQGEEAA